MQVTRNNISKSVAFVGAIAAGAGMATGLVTATRGETTGAPGIAKAFSRIGKSVGKSMATGVAITGGAAALAAVTVYEGVQLLERR